MSDVAANPVETAPTDGRLLRLLVRFTEHPLEDSSDPVWTIGHNNDGNVGEGEGVGFQFAGWCWSHDHFTEGRGQVIGWLPYDAAIVRTPCAPLTAASVIARIAEAARVVGWQAGEAGCDIAGGIVSFLANHPEEIDRFMTGDGGMMIDGTFRPETGALTWRAVNGEMMDAATYAARLAKAAGADQ